MAELLEESQIGPLSPGMVSAESVAWGIDGRQIVTDSATAEVIDQRFDRYVEEAAQVAEEELTALLAAVAEDAKPSNILHTVLVRGPLTIERIAGLVGRPVQWVAPRLEALVFVDLIREVGPTVSSRGTRAPTDSWARAWWVRRSSMGRRVDDDYVVYEYSGHVNVSSRAGH